MEGVPRRAASVSTRAGAASSTQSDCQNASSKERRIYWAPYLSEAGQRVAGACCTAAGGGASATSNILGRRPLAAGARHHCQLVGVARQLRRAAALAHGGRSTGCCAASPDRSAGRLQLQLCGWSPTASQSEEAGTSCLRPPREASSTRRSPAPECLPGPKLPLCQACACRQWQATS